MGGAVRRPDQAGQDLVLRGHRPMGFHGSAAERLLQLAAGHSQRSRQGRCRSDADAVLPGPAGLAVCEHRRPTRVGLPRRFDWYRNHARARDHADRRSKNRFNIYGDLQKSCRCTTGPFTGANAIESERGWDWYPSGVVQGTWTAPLTSRLLLEAGASWQTANWVNFAEQGVSRDDRSILETATNYRYGATTLLTAPKSRNRAQR